MTWQFNWKVWRLPWHRKRFDTDFEIDAHFAGIGPFQFHWWSRSHAPK